MLVIRRETVHWWDFRVFPDLYVTFKEGFFLFPFHPFHFLLWVVFLITDPWLWDVQCQTPVTLSPARRPGSPFTARAWLPRSNSRCGDLFDLPTHPHLSFPSSSSSPSFASRPWTATPSGLTASPQTSSLLEWAHDIQGSSPITTAPPPPVTLTHPPTPPS